MHVSFAVPLAVAAALTGCGGQRAPVVDRHLPPAVATPPSDVALLRVSRTGGTAELLHSSTLAPQEVVIGGGLPPITHLLGASVEDKIIYAADNAGHLVAIDLIARRFHIVPTSARQLTGAPDGTILGIDSARHPVRFANRTITTFRATVDRNALLLRGPGDQVLVSGRPGSLQVVGDKGEDRHLTVPVGRVTATWVGDLVAVTTDSGVEFVDPTGKAPRGRGPTRFIRIRGRPTVATFSPSGHRLYVARKSGGMVMVDRFARTVLSTKELPLPGNVDGLRADRSGRWLLVRATGGDSVWVVDLSRWVVALTRAAPWGDDLPQVVDGHILLVRHAADLVAIDLDADTAPIRGVLVGGAADLYTMLPWIPVFSAPTIEAATKGPATPASAIATPSDTVSPGAAPADSATAVATPELALPPGAATIYLQISSSQNQEWAKALAKQLEDGGFPARVLDPKTTDEGYRVVVGPYTTRASADSVGKRLGRSYFIITAGSGDT